MKDGHDGMARRKLVVEDFFHRFGIAIGAFVAAATSAFPIVGLAIADSRSGGWCPAPGLFLQIDDGRF
jgi:hypothetical protein